MIDIKIKVYDTAVDEPSGNETSVSDDVSTEVAPDQLRNEAVPAATSETTTEKYSSEAIADYGYEYQYSDIEFLSPYDDEISEYITQEVDNRPYLSSEVANADINDVYTMVLSIRNVVLLWFLIWMIFKCRGFIHSIFDIVLERSKRK